MEHVGQMGKFQLCIYLLLCWPILIMSSTVSSIVFTTAIPEYRCLVPGCDVGNDPDFDTPWLNTTIPNEETSSGSFRLSRCEVYNTTWPEEFQCYELPPDTNSTCRCNQWIYDKSNFDTTIVTEYNLTCRNEWIQAVVAALFMLGMLFGASIFGPIADRLGRKPAFIIAILWMSTFVIVSCFTPDAWSHGVVRFIAGLGAIGTFITTYVWGIEHVGPRYLVLCGFIFQCMGPISGIIMTGIAYLSRDWKVVQLITGVPILICLTYWWIIPESPRWLLSKRKYKEAKEVIIKVAKFNRKEIPQYILDEFDSKINSNMNLENEENQDNYQNNNTGRFSEIFKTPVLRNRILIMIVAWVAADMAYFSLSLTSTFLSGDFYINFLLSMVIEIPSYFTGIYSMGVIGRRFTLSFALLLCGGGCLVAGLVPSEMPDLITGFSLVAKFGSAIVLATVYSFTSELFPTANRSAAVGLCATLGRVGAVLGPLIAIMARLVSIGLPFIVIGIVSLVVGLLTLLLPETLGRSLPMTIEEAVDLNSNKFKWRGFWPKK